MDVGVPAGPGSGRVSVFGDGVENPNIEYSTPLLGAAVRFNATRKR